MLKYTICFIKQGNKILLLNREKPTWMGMWNGVGGKIEPNETPRESILREITEETGMTIGKVQFKGLVTWNVDQFRVGGMYTYFAELPNAQTYITPIQTDEGILDWKELNWILNPDNQGIAYFIPKCIGKIISDEQCHEYYCHYENDQLVKVETKEVDEAVEFNHHVFEQLYSNARN